MSQFTIVKTFPKDVTKYLKLLMMLVAGGGGGGAIMASAQMSKRIIFTHFLFQI